MRAMRICTGVLIIALCFVSGVRGQTQQSSKEALAAGRVALREHNYREAIRIFEDALKKSPNNRDVKNELGRAYLYNHQDDRAMQLFREVLKDDPENRTAKLELARALGYHKDYEASNRLYRELLKGEADEQAEAGLVRNLMHQGKTAEAKHELETALARHPDSQRLKEYKNRLEQQKYRPTRLEPRPAVWEKQGRVAGTTGYYSDSVGNRSWRSSQEFDYRFAPAFGLKTQVEERTLWNSTSPKANVLWGTGDLQFRPTRAVILSAGGGAARFANGGGRGLYRGEVELQPVKHLYVSGGFSRIPVAPTFLATQFNLVADEWNARVRWHSQAWRAFAEWKGQQYSDGNHGKRAEAEFVRWFGTPQLSIGAGYQFRYIGFSQTLLHGYFNPGRYQSHLGVGGIKVGAGRFRGEYLVRMGGESIAPAAYQSAWELALRNRMLLQQWELGADYFYFHLAQDAGPFTAQMGRFVIAYRF